MCSSDLLHKFTEQVRLKHSKSNKFSNALWISQVIQERKREYAAKRERENEDMLNNNQATNFYVKGNPILCSDTSLCVSHATKDFTKSCCCE